MVDYEGDLPEGIVDLGGGEYLIQGKPVGSSYEVNIAIALSNAKHQYEYLAGWWIGGSKLEIDFRIYSIVPKLAWLFVDGSQWHQGDETQRDKIERLRLYDLTKSFAQEPYVAKNPDCDTYDHAWGYVIKNFGRH